MYNFIKRKVKRILYRHRAESNTLVDYYRRMGMRIGERTIFFSPSNVWIDETRPWLVEIGDDVQVTDGVKILTHGYDWAVIKKETGEILGSCGKVKIGNNVFIGMNTTILKGVTIGNNVIIGANSLVNSGVIPDNVVIAGNPARVICGLEEYIEKRKKVQLDEARELVKEYYNVYKTKPTKEILHEYFYLFSDVNSVRENKKYKKMMKLVGNEENSYNALKSFERPFENYQEFLRWCFDEKQ